MPELPVTDNQTDDAHAPPLPAVPDAVPGPGIERIVRIAAQSLDMPVALFVQADGGHCRCRSQVGLAPAQAASLATLWGAGLPWDEPVCIDDLCAEPWRSAMPGLPDGPDLRFHVGVPVRGPGGPAIGALWLFDRRPRDVGTDKLAMLADLALMLERELATHRLEQRLARQDDHERSMRGLLDYLPEGVLMLGADGRIVACNAAAERIYGAAANGLVGRHAIALTGEDPARLRSALQAGDMDQLQAVARRVDGSDFMAEFSIKLLDASGPRRYALAVRDISARKEREHALREADERRRKYFVTATHELRTPMASVLGFSELLLKYDFNGAELREMTEIIHRQASRLVRLINEMLDLARIESGGKDALDLRPQDPGALLAQTLSGLEGLGATQRIRAHVAPGLPPVLADMAKVQQALTNIISNAIKYSTPSTEIGIEVFATRLPAGMAVGFRVVDRGIGMTAEQKAHVFEPFYRARSEPDTVGTGLGMTIFKEIVDLHHGVVHIDSTPGAGTTVTLSLPAAAPGN